MRVRCSVYLSCFRCFGKVFSRQINGVSRFFAASVNAEAAIESREEVHRLFDLEKSIINSWLLVLRHCILIRALNFFNRVTRFIVRKRVLEETTSSFIILNKTSF